MGFLTDVGRVMTYIPKIVPDMRKATIDGGDYADSRAPGGALFVNPETWAVSGMLYKEKPAIVNYSVLRYICKRDTVLATIILTRLRQVKAFSRPISREDSDHTNKTGFRVESRKGAGQKGSASVKREDELNQFFWRCGRPDMVTQEGSFPRFLWKFTKDRLEFDQPCSVIQLDRKGEPVQFYAVDGATIRIVNPAKRQTTGFKYVQIYNNRPVAGFKENEFMFCPENLSTQLELDGYSVAESELAVKKVMAHLGIDETNFRQFQPGSMPKGLLTIVNADMSEEQIQLFEARYKAQVANFRGKHRLPLLPIPRGGDMKFLGFPQANDLEFGNFLDYLVNTCCGLYGMDLWVPSCGDA